MAFSSEPNGMADNDGDDVVTNNLVCDSVLFAANETREMLNFMFSDSGGDAHIQTSATNVSEEAIPENLLEVADDDVQINYRSPFGSGAFCTVYPVHLKNSSGAFDTNKPPLALKKLNLQVKKNEKIVKFATLDLKREADILSKISHENIIRMYGRRKEQTENDAADGAFFIVIDVLAGTLDTKLVTWKKNRGLKKFTPHDSVMSRLEGVAMGIAKGMAFLHSNKIIFRDLKPDNIGFDKNRIVKIFDFGLAQDLTEATKTTGRIGTRRYMAPEVAANETYGFEADVFSFAILLWEIVTSRIPYEAEISTFSAGTPQVDGKRPSNKYVESKELQALFEKAWAAKGKDRPSFSEIAVEMQKIIKMQPETSSRTQRQQPKRKLLRSLFNR